MSRLFPKLRYKNVQSVDFDVLKLHNIKGIALDIDNTLIDMEKRMPEGIKEWVEEAEKRGFKVCILSNSNKIKKVTTVAQTLNLEYIKSAKKPFKCGYKKAIELLGLKAEEIAVIGDQLFTDVLGANKMGMLSVYVDPIDLKEYWYTSWKRPIEKVLLNKYEERNKGVR